MSPDLDLKITSIYYMLIYIEDITWWHKDMDKIHVFEPPCFFLFIICKPVNDVIDIFTSEDMENMSLVKHSSHTLLRGCCTRKQA